MSLVGFASRWGWVDVGSDKSRHVWQPPSQSCHFCLTFTDAMSCLDGGWMGNSNSFRLRAVYGWADVSSNKGRQPWQRTRLRFSHFLTSLWLIQRWGFGAYLPLLLSSFARLRDSWNSCFSEGFRALLGFRHKTHVSCWLCRRWGWAELGSEEDRHLWQRPKPKLSPLFGIHGRGG